MARIELAPALLADFDRILRHLAEHEVEQSASRIEDIIAALDILERNPLIGREGRGENRELVIGRGTRGYVALYRYIPALDVVFVLAIRSQREAGYARAVP